MAEEKETRRSHRPFSGLAISMDAPTFDPDDLILVESKDHPVMPHLYDTDVHLPVDEGTVRSIMYQGVLEPCIIEKGPDGKPYIVDGRSRVRAAREAKRRLLEQGKDGLRIQCVVRRGTEADLFGVVIAANEHRHDISPLARAEKCSRYLALGRTDEEAAVVFGVSVRAIQNWMKLLGLAAPVRKAVEAKKIDATAALKLFKLPVKEQVETLEQLLGGGNVSAGTQASPRRMVDQGENPQRAEVNVASINPRAGTDENSSTGLATRQDADADADENPRNKQEKHRASFLKKPKKEAKPSARKVEAVVKGEISAKEAAPKMKTRAQILRRLKEEAEEMPKDFRAALLWVLGEV